MADQLLNATEGMTNADALNYLTNELKRIKNKDVYCHYFDIRTNGLNEKDWRRSFSINQLLYGMILAVEKNHKIETFDEIMEQLKQKYQGKEVESVKPYGIVWNTKTEEYDDYDKITYADGTFEVKKHE